MTLGEARALEARCRADVRNAYWNLCATSRAHPLRGTCEIAYEAALQALEEAEIAVIATEAIEAMTAKTPL